MPIYEELAKAKQVEATIKGNKTRHNEDLPVVEKLPQLVKEPPAPKARDEAAKATGANGRYVQEVKIHCKIKDRSKGGFLLPDLWRLLRVQNNRKRMKSILLVTYW